MLSNTSSFIWKIMKIRRYLKLLFTSDNYFNPSNYLEEQLEFDEMPK